MNVIIAGGTGHLGQLLRQKFTRDGHDVTIISRSRNTAPGTTTVLWTDDLVSVLDGADAVINLAGAGLSAHRWTPRYKRTLIESRTIATRTLVEAISQCIRPPALVSLSGTGYYGNTMTPSSEAMGAGQTFLAQLCVQWEQEALQASNTTRVVILRMAPVLDPSFGMLAAMLGPIRMFVGGVLGTGNQWVPWIHRDDAIASIVWAASTTSAQGAYIVASKDCVTMRDMVKMIGDVVHRPTFLPVPTFVLRLILGSQADIVLHGQRIAPYRLESEGFELSFHGLEGALRDLLR